MPHVMSRYIRYNHLWEITYRPLTNESSPEYQTAMQKLTQVRAAIFLTVMAQTGIPSVANFSHAASAHASECTCLSPSVPQQQ